MFKHGSRNALNLDILKYSSINLVMLKYSSRNAHDTRNPLNSRNAGNAHYSGPR